MAAVCLLAGAGTTHYVTAETTGSPTGPGTRALDVLALITVENEHQQGYDRALFVEGRDDDEDGCATRAEVLIRDTLVLPQVDPFGCHVLGRGVVVRVRRRHSDRPGVARG